MSATVATLRAMRVRLGVPERWTTHCLARNGDRQPCEPLDPIAVCWCLEGAAVVEAKARNISYWVIDLALQDALTHINRYATYPEWQDRHTHAEMLGLIDRAIELTEAAQ